MSYITPALTPTSGQPAFRVYTVDPVTFGVLDVASYITNLSSPNYQTSGPTWTEYYSAKSVYGPLVSPTIASDPTAELTPAFWHNVTQVLATNQTAFDEYYARKSRGYNVASCTGDCVTNEVCQLMAARSENNCVVVTPGINFKRKRSLVEERVQESECGGSAMGRILRKMVQGDGVLSLAKRAS